MKACRRVDILSSFILWPVYLHENSLWYVLEELTETSSNTENPAMQPVTIDCMMACM